MELAERKKVERCSVADAFAEARRICAEEGYELAIHPRVDRPNPFLDDARPISLRRQGRP
jgi:hypothetical protein